MRAEEVVAYGARGASQQERVAVAMDADRMAGSNDLGRECPVVLDLLADEEERRNRVRAVKCLEHGRGALAMGPVVEGERNPAPSRKRALRRRLASSAIPGVSSYSARS